MTCASDTVAVDRCRAFSPFGSFGRRLRRRRTGEICLALRLSGFPRPLGEGIRPLVPRLRVCTLHFESFHGAFPALPSSFCKKLNLPQPTIITNLGFATWRAQLYVDLPIALSFFLQTARP